MFDSEEVLNHAITFFQSGRFNEALELCMAVLQQEPHHARANYVLGLIFLQRMAPEDALPFFQAAWEGDPAQGEYWLGLAECLISLGRFEKALDLLSEAVKHGMNDDRSKELRSLAKRGKSRKSPGSAVVERMVALFNAKQYEELEQSVRPLMAHFPGWNVGWNLLGNALSAQGKDAEGVLLQAVRLAPAEAGPYNNLGVHLRKIGRMEEAIAHLKRAIEIKPDYVDAHFNLGAAFLDLRRFDEAMLHLRIVLDMRPETAEAYNAMGLINREVAKLGEAETCYRRALELMPDFVDAKTNLAATFLQQGKIEETVRLSLEVLERQPNNAVAFSNYLFALAHNVDVGPEKLFAEHLRFAETFERPLLASWPPFPNDRNPERELRVGIVSGDLFDHAVSSFIGPILPELANQGMRLYAYSNNVVEDNVTAGLRKNFALWKCVAGMSDAELAQEIRADRIDILIDLSGHTGRNRLLTFAHKPAPLQASWIGYLGSTGLESMDYYLADRYLLPEKIFDLYFAEKIVRLPALAPFRPYEWAPPVNELPALSNGYVTFGSFNRISKISDAVVALWARLLRELPNSKMLLGGGARDGNSEYLMEKFIGEGVARERLLFYPRSDMFTYLALHHQVDICLDAFPYNGGTTTQHALWMGVPTLTLAGETAVSRCGAMNLGYQGLNEFVAYDKDEFVRRGLEWAGRLEDLGALRLKMREQFLKSAPGRPDLVAAGVGKALRIMWRRWCEGLPPEAFDVEIDELTSEGRISG